jgi:glutathione S-transferase
MIRLWGRTNSLNVQKVLWTLAELDLRYERTDAGLKFGIVDTPAYRAMNPNGLVPTIDDDGFVLWESNAIVRYLTMKHASGTLYPADTRERFSAERWMDWQQTSLNPPIGLIFFNLIRLPAERRDMAAVSRNLPLAEGCLAILDEQLAAHDYVNGSRFTMADIPAGTSVSRWSKLPIDRQSRPNVERWLTRLKERPGFKTHVDQPLS